MMLATQAAAGAAVGMLAGLLFFRALRSNAALYLREGAAWRPIALHLARLLLLAGLLVGVVQAAGGAGLLASFAGILAARGIVLRSERSAAR